MNIKYFACLIIVLMSFNFSSFAQEKWLWEEEVVYQEHHDPMMVYLKDGRGLEYRGENAFEKMEAWEVGKKLKLAYNSEDGLNLVDMNNNDLISILFGLETHPIDLLCDFCLANDEGTTRGLAKCYYDASKLWDAELNRVYKKIIAKSTDEEKKKIKAAQLKWIEFRDAEIEYMNELYFSDDCGSICRISRASSVCDLTRSQAERLNSFLLSKH